MPTGYTADVADGKVTELEPFVLQLARGMGALVMMRDDPWDKPIPDRFEPSNWNADKLAAAKAERDRLYAMTDSEAQVEADREYASNKQREADYLADNVARRARYQAMIDKISNWTGAPEGIKEFGLQQLTEGMRFDCPQSPSYYREVVQRTGVEWRAAALEKASHDIEYHTVEDSKERARTDGRNAWIAQLRASLAGAA